MISQNQIKGDIFLIFIGFFITIASLFIPYTWFSGWVQGMMMMFGILIVIGTVFYRLDVKYGGFR